MAERNAFEELLYLQAKETDWTLLPDIEAVEINWDHKFKLNFDSIPDPEERAAVWFDFNVSTKRGLGELSTFKEVPKGGGHFFIMTKYLYVTEGCLKTIAHNGFT